MIGMESEASELHVYSIQCRIEVQCVVGANMRPRRRNPLLRCCVFFLYLRQNTTARKVGLPNCKDLPLSDLLVIADHGIVDSLLEGCYSILGVSKTLGRFSCAGPADSALFNAVHESRTKLLSDEPAASFSFHIMALFDHVQHDKFFWHPGCFPVDSVHNRPLHKVPLAYPLHLEILPTQ